MDIRGVVAEVSRVLHGKESTIEKSLVCLLAGGHLLIEDIPGVGKTTLALAIAKTMNLSFSRIQFTSDLLPSDITGNSVYDPKENEFTFKEGAIFRNVVLADEINRATPKTQSALLEAMAEGQVTVDGTTYRLPQPFFVIATQNPVEHYGTYPLPESQLDRFMMRLSLGYPDRDTEVEILEGINPADRVERLRSMVNQQDIVSAVKEVRNIHLSREVAEFMVDIAAGTRTDPRVILGVSTRGVIHLSQGARAVAYVRGRDFVVPEDVLEVAEHILSHRLIVREGHDKAGIVRDILQSVEVPK